MPTRSYLRATEGGVLLTLAYTLRCAPNRVEIVRGAASPQKRIMLHGFKEQDVLRATEA